MRVPAATFFETSIWTVAHRGGLCHVEFQGAPEDAQNWFVGSAGIKKALHQMRIPGWLQAFFARPAVLASPKLGTQEKRSIEDHLLLIL